MRTKKAILIGFLLMMLVGLILVVPTSAQAGRGHGHGHHRHGGHGHHHHYHHHPGGYNFVYTQPRVYYNQPYYPQPRYNYYPAVPVYGYPPNVMMGIGTGNMDFMIRF